MKLFELQEVAFSVDVQFPGRGMTQRRFKATPTDPIRVQETPAGSVVVLTADGKTVYVPVTRIEWYVPVPTSMSGRTGSEEAVSPGTSQPGKPKNQARRK